MKRTRALPLCTRALRCCLHQNRLRFSERGARNVITREIALSLTNPRYYARDFERRWQRRLKTPLRRTTNSSSQLHVEVTHRFPAPNRYSWELRPVAGLPMEESRVQFASWEEASQAGKLALNQFLQHL